MAKATHTAQPLAQTQDEVQGVKNANPEPSYKDKIAGIDYKNLRGEAFKKYAAVAGDGNLVDIDQETGSQKGYPGELNAFENYDYEEWKAEPIIVERFPGVKGSPRDFVGVRLKGDKPIKVTRITPRHALMMNAQIINDGGRQNGRYYLLAK